MNVVICWSHISGYMAACWRALAETAGVRLFVVAFEPESSAPFDRSLMAGLPHRLLTPTERQDAKLVCDLVASHKPDVVMVSGWSHPAFRAVCADRRMASAAKLMTLDTQPRFDFRQLAGRWIRREFFSKIDRAIAIGERAAVCARYLGFRADQIKVGACGINFAGFGTLSEQRTNWPRKWLYVGRYAPEKGLDILVKGYELYRRAAIDPPWELVCCGSGPEKHRLSSPGIIDLGFVPPDHQPKVFADAGGFVIASRFEPWGVAIAEAAAAGLPLICSDACGAVADVLREGFNGYTFTSGDAEMLARRMLQTANEDVRLMGERSRHLAAPFDAALWPRRVFDGYL